MRGPRATTEFTGYLRALVAQRRLDPQGDLISALVQAREVGEALNEDELISMCMFLLVAGHETTTNLIGNGIHALLGHPEQFHYLQRHPEAAAAAAEEVMRFDSPVQFAFRDAHVDLVYKDVQIPKGGLVGFVLGSANRDERWCARPDEFDITREAGRGTLAFGGGIHHCLGAPLARLEGAIALRQWAERFSHRQLVAGKAVRAAGIAFRGFASLPVIL